LLTTCMLVALNLLHGRRQIFERRVVDDEDATKGVILVLESTRWLPTQRGSERLATHVLSLNSDPFVS